MEVFRIFIFNVIIDMVTFKPLILLYYLSHSFFFPPSPFSAFFWGGLSIFLSFYLISFIGFFAITLVVVNLVSALEFIVYTCLIYHNLPSGDMPFHI